MADVLPKFEVIQSNARMAFVAVGTDGERLAEVRFDEMPSSSRRVPTVELEKHIRNILAQRILAAMERENAAKEREKRLNELEDLERFAWI